jgi:hypothetical protein
MMTMMYTPIYRSLSDLSVTPIPQSPPRLPLHCTVLTPSHASGTGASVGTVPGPRLETRRHHQACLFGLQRKLQDARRSKTRPQRQQQQQNAPPPASASPCSGQVAASTQLAARVALALAKYWGGAP